ncbi:MAG: amidohydrolase [Mogibacterium sp.]|nr:amidohydrolase [Mogibacterium sp.]
MDKIWEDKVFKAAADLYDNGDVLANRRDIHAHPELGTKEFRTAALIKEKLEEYGVDRVEQLTPTSVCAWIHGNKGPGKTIALRTDIDALPVKEETGLPFASEYEGVMHACGHDIHCAMMLGNARLLCGMRDEFPGTVKLIFQHSEDTQPGGSKELVALGVMDDVNAIIGMHVFPDEDPGNYGKIIFKPGAITSSSDLCMVTVKGKGGHSSEPHKLKDPVLAAAQMIILLQQINARYIDGKETFIFPIAYVHGGNKINVIPDEVTFGGVPRAYSNAVRDVCEEQCFKIARGVEELSGCRIDLKYVRGYAPCYNDQELHDIARRCLIDTMGEDYVIDQAEPMSFSEDFGAYSDMTGKPGLFLIIKAGHATSFAPLHNAKCTFNERVIPYGITGMCNIAIGYLNQQ